MKANDATRRRSGICFSIEIEKSASESVKIPRVSQTRLQRRSVQVLCAIRRFQLCTGPDQDLNLLVLETMSGVSAGGSRDDVSTTDASGDMGSAPDVFPRSVHISNNDCLLIVYILTNAKRIGYS